MRGKRISAMVLTAFLITTGIFVFLVSEIGADDVQHIIYGNVDPNSTTNVRAYNDTQNGFIYFYIQNRTNEGNVVDEIVDSFPPSDQYDPYISKEEGGENGLIADWQIGDPGIMIIEREYGSYGTGDHAGYIAFINGTLTNNPFDIFDTVELQKIPTPTQVENGTDYINITWDALDDPNGLIAGYKIYRSEYNNSDSNWTLVPGCSVNNPLTDLYYNDTSLSPSTKYYYSVKVCFIGYQDNETAQVDNYQNMYFGEGSAPMYTSGLPPTVDYIALTDWPDGFNLTVVNLPVGGNVIVFASGYNVTTGYVGLVEVDWIEVPGTLGDFNVTLGETVTFTVFTTPGSVDITGQNTTMVPSVSDNFTVNILPPTVDFIQIRDAAGGVGNIVNMGTYSVSEIDEFYAAAYNFTYGYMGDVSVTWNSDFPSVGDVDTPTGIWTNFTAQQVLTDSTCTVTATYNATIGDSTGLLTVLAPRTDYVQIRTAAGGGGINLCDPANYPSYYVGNSTTFYGAAYNITVGYLGDVDVTSTWDSTDFSIVDVTLSGISSTITCDNTNWGTVTITLTDGSISNFTMVTVLIPTVDYIQIRDAAGGLGNVVNTMTYSVLDTDEFYAAAYNITAGYLGDVVVDWSSDAPSVGDVDTLTGFQTNFTAQQVATDSTCTITADYGGGIMDTTDLLTVLAPTIDYVQIRTADNGGGLDLCDLANYPNYQKNTVTTFYGAGYNDTVGFIGAVPTTSTWDSNDTSIVDLNPINPATGNQTTVSCSPTNSGWVWVTLDYGGITNTTKVTVLAWTVDYILIRNAPGGGGLNLCDPANYTSYPVGIINPFYGAAYNYSAPGDGYIGIVNISSTWDSTDFGIVDVTITGDSSTITCSNTNWGTVTIELDDHEGHIVTTQVTVIKPTIDYIQIRDMPNNGGNVVDTRTYSVWDTDEFYAAGYNNTANYVEDVSVTWDINPPGVGQIDTLTGIWTNFTAEWVAVDSTCTITADYGGGITDSTGLLTVLAPIIDYVQIRTAAGGGGIDLSDPGNYPTYQKSTVTTFFGAGYNNTVGFIGAVPTTSTWDSNDTSIVDLNPITPATGNQTTVTCSPTNSGLVWVTLDYLGITAQTQVTVLAWLVDYIQIRTASGGLGDNLCDAVNYPSYPVGYGTTFYGAVYNISAPGDGYLGDVDISSIWDSTNFGIVDVTLTGDSSTITCSNTNWGIVTITLTDGLFSNTTDVTVIKPTIDFIQIRDASGGAGDEVTTRTYSVGDTDEFYAAGYNFTAGYVEDVSVTWNSDDPTVGDIDTLTGIWTNFTAQWVASDDTCTITADYSGIGDSTGLLTVLTPTVDYIQIRDAAGGAGNVVTTGTYSVSEMDDFYAAAYNFTVDYLNDVSVTWDSDDPGVGQVTTPGTSTTFTAQQIATDDTCTVTADYGGGITTSTGLLTVLAPTADYVQIRTASGGLGIDLCDAANYPSYYVGNTTTFYGAMYNNTVGYYADVPATAIWMSDDTNIVTVLPSGTSTTVTCDNQNWGTVTITLTETVSGETNTTQVTVLEPTVDYIQIRDEPDGLGNVLSNMNYVKGANDTYYGAAYNSTAGYIGPVNATTSTWDSDDLSIITVNPTTGISTLIECSDINSGIVLITLDDGQGHQYQTTVNVLEWVVDYVQIRTASGGGGTDLCAPGNYPSYPVGYSTTFWGAMYNWTGGYLGDVSSSALWGSDDPGVVSVSGSGTSITITCDDLNWGTARITLIDVDNGLNNFTDVTVIEPTVDYIQIRDSPDGGGTVLSEMANYPTYPLDYSTTFYGAEYNDTAGYIGAVPATSGWTSNDTAIVQVTSPGEDTDITCSNVNWGWVWVNVSAGPGLNASTQVTVLEVRVDYIQIRSAPGGGGIDLGDPMNYQMYPVGYSTQFYAAAYNNSFGFIVDISVGWLSDGPTIVDVTATGAFTTVQCSDTNDGTITITADDGSGHTNTTDVTVSPPTIDYIQIRDAPMGGGNVVSNPSYPVGHTTTFYGARYNITAGFLEEVPVSSEWGSTDDTIVTVTQFGVSTTVTCSDTLSGPVIISLVDGTYPTSTQVSVLDPTVDYIQIRNATDGGGIEVIDPSYPVGFSIMFYGARYNITSGFIDNVPVFSEWSSTDDTIASAGQFGASSTITCSDTNGGTVTITLDDKEGHTDTTDVTVIDPTVDYIVIRDTSGGAGVWVGDQTYNADDTDYFYAASYNNTADYIGDVSVTWVSDETTVGQVVSSGSSTTFTAMTLTADGTCTVTATYPVGISNSTGVLTVLAPVVTTIDYIQIRDEAGGLGNIVTTATFDEDDTDRYYAAGYNNDGTYIEDVASADWSTTIGSVSPATGASTTYTATSYGTGTLTVTYGSLSNSTSITIRNTNPPATPLIPGASAFSSNQVIVAWLPNTEPDLDHYVLQRSESATGPFTNITTVPSDTMIYNDTTVEPETTYYYRVIAVDTAGNPSTPSQASLPVTTPAPGEPTVDEFPWLWLLLFLIIAIILIVLFLILYWKKKKEGEEEMPPGEEEAPGLAPSEEIPPEEAPPAAVAPVGAAVEAEEEKPPEEHVCKICGGTMEFVADYDSWYCYNCEKYEGEEDEEAEPTEEEEASEELAEEEVMEFEEEEMKPEEGPPEEKPPEKPPEEGQKPPAPPETPPSEPTEETKKSPPPPP